jgi:hypothetical protein
MRLYDRRLLQNSLVSESITRFALLGQDLVGPKLGSSASGEKDGRQTRTTLSLSNLMRTYLLMPMLSSHRWELSLFLPYWQLSLRKRNTTEPETLRIE